jgi:hypothetical protein
LSGGAEERATDFDGPLDLGFVSDREGRPLQGGADLYEHVDEALEPGWVEREAGVGEYGLEPLGEALVHEASLCQQQPQCNLWLSGDELAQWFDLNGRGHHPPDGIEHAIFASSFRPCESVADERHREAFEDVFEQLLA